MDDSVAGVVLAAGAGTRLAPLTRELPKALCPVGGVPLVDLALARAGRVAADLAVNLHHGADLLDAHLPPGVHRSFERAEALGTAGALGALRPWLDGRDALVANADAWLPTDVAVEALANRWDRERVRLLCVRDPARGDFGDLRYCGVALMPAAVLSGLRPEPSGLYEACWRSEAAAGRLDLVVHPGAFVDCGTPRDYLRANLADSGGASVIDPAAHVAAGTTVVRSVVWAGATVVPGDRLVDAIRTPRHTVLVR